MESNKNLTDRIVAFFSIFSQFVTVERITICLQSKSGVIVFTLISFHNQYYLQIYCHRFHLFTQEMEEQTNECAIKMVLRDCIRIGIYISTCTDGGVTTLRLHCNANVNWHDHKTASAKIINWWINKECIHTTKCLYEINKRAFDSIINLKVYLQNKRFHLLLYFNLIAFIFLVQWQWQWRYSFSTNHPCAHCNKQWAILMQRKWGWFIRVTLTCN